MSGVMWRCAGVGDGEGSSPGVEVRAHDSDDQELPETVHQSGPSRLRSSGAGAGVSGELSGGADACGVRVLAIPAVYDSRVLRVFGESDAGLVETSVGRHIAALHGVQAIRTGAVCEGHARVAVQYEGVHTSCGSREVQAPQGGLAA